MLLATNPILNQRKENSMSESNTRRDFLKMAGAATAAAFTGKAMASDSPFGIKEMEQGYENTHLAEGKCGGKGPEQGKGMEGKCGEGKCGGGQKDMEGRCGEGRRPEHSKGKGMEGKCGEGKCGEGKCGNGAKKGMEGKCGGSR
jgi:uncharacterized low-complexity protein